MRNLKKFLALVLAMMMVFSMMMTVNAASFIDISGNDYEDAIKMLYNYGIVEGDGNGNFNPNGQFTRAQMAGIAYRIATGDVNDEYSAQNAVYAQQQFSDVPSNYWAAGYIGFCANWGIVNGDGTGKFNPNDTVTGYQIAVLMLNLLGYGKNGEFLGSNWTKNAGEMGIKTGITTGLGNTSLSAVATRAQVAQVAYAAAFNTSRVDYIGGAYITTGVELIDIVSETPTTDEWGAPATNYSAAFTWNEYPKITENLIADDALVEVWTPITQAEVYTQAKMTGAGATLDTYTNGVYAAGGQTISPNGPYATTDIGGQGRWTRVYSDRIVYVDTFLSRMIRVVPEVTVNGRTAIQAQYTAYSYYNDYDVTQAVNGVYATAAYTATIYELGTTSFAVGDFIASYGEAAADPFYANGQITTGLIDPYAATVRRNVTVNYILKDPTGTITGVGTNSGEYLYNCTYAYNGGSSKERLTDTDIGSTVTLYLDARNNILGVVPTSNTNSGVGVVLSADAGRISGGKYYGQVTVQTVSGNVTLKFIDPWTGSQNQLPYSTENDALTDAEALVGNLVSWGTDTASASTNGYTGYVIITPANNGSPENVTDDTIEAGDAEALDKNVGAAYGLYLSDDTVFFVANYTMQNSRGGWGFTNYSVTEGFQNIRDLSFSGSNVVWNNPNPNGASSGLQVEWIDLYGDGWVDYVLVMNAVNKTTNVVEPVDNYVFLANPSAFVKVYDNYFQYSGIRNGAPNWAFRVDYNATNSIDETALYTYSEYTNEGWSAVEKSGNVVRGGNYGYYEGVLYYGGSYSPATDIVTDANTFYTVADGAAIYIVNDTTGDCTRVPFELDIVQMAYPDSDIWFQLNQFGWINYIYVVDDGTALTVNGAELLDVTLGIGTGKESSAPPSVGAFVNGYGFTVVSAAPQSGVGSFNGQVTVSATWLKLNDAGNYVAYTADAFTAGSYRLQLTFTVRNASGENYFVGSLSDGTTTAVTVSALSGIGVTSPLAFVSGSTFISNLITVS